MEVSRYIAPPSPEPGLFGSHLFLLRRDPVGYLQQAARDFGDVVRLRLAPWPSTARRFDLYLLSHPDHVRDVLATRHDCFVKSWDYHVLRRLGGEGLFTSEEPLHRRQRKLILPAFHHGRIAAYADVMAACADRRSRTWQPGTVLEVQPEMTTLTLAIVAQALFGRELGNEVTVFGQALTNALECLFLLLNPLRDRLSVLPLPTVLRFNRAKRRLDETVERLLQEHRMQGGDRGDLISMLRQARHEDDGSPMPDQQVHDEVITMLLAGHETTTQALSWTWYLLAQHPAVEAQLHTEIDDVLAGRLPALEDLPRLPYTRRVLTEAMRLYPPVWAIGRIAVRDVPFGPYLIPAGATVYVCPYIVHRDPQFFPDPERFDPDRWNDAFKRALPKFAYFPFGGGPRGCLGEQFAWMEGTLVLATLAQRWRLRLLPGQKVRPQAVITLRPERGLPMRLEAR